MFTIPYIETREEFFYLDVFLKLLLGLLAIALVINKSGKGNLAPTSAMDQVQNYVLGGIIGHLRGVLREGQGPAVGTGWGHRGGDL